jgi:hypothetical protein
LTILPTYRDQFVLGYKVGHHMDLWRTGLLHRAAKLARDRGLGLG